MISRKTEVQVLNYNCIYMGEICAPLGYYAAMNGNSVPTFQDNLSPHLQGRSSKLNAFILDLPLYSV
jgi:hypothetical protein